MNVRIHSNVKVRLNPEKIIGKVRNDELGLYVSQEWYELQKRYIPRRSGMLMHTVSVQPWRIVFTAPHAGIVYRGKRKGVDMVFKRDKNPLATAFWDRAAARDGQLAVLYRRINTKLRGGG